MYILDPFLASLSLAAFPFTMFDPDYKSLATLREKVLFRISEYPYCFWRRYYWLFLSFCNDISQP